MATQRSGDKKVRTVLGDVDPRKLGKTDVHEHLFVRPPLLRGEELDDREKSTQEAVELRQGGIDALVELTTIGLGRDPRGVAGGAQRATRGAGYRHTPGAHYPPEHGCARGRRAQAIGGDVARRTAFRSYGGLPGMAYLPRRFAPCLAEMGGEDLVRRILIDNPARFLGFIPPEDG